VHVQTAVSGADSRHVGRSRGSSRTKEKSTASPDWKGTAASSLPSASTLMTVATSPRTGSRYHRVSDTLQRSTRPGHPSPTLKCTRKRLPPRRRSA
jgi:hypothetical protein